MTEKNQIIKALIEAKQWQVDVAKKLCEVRQSTMQRNRLRDDLWYIDSRGQGILNIEKALKTPAGQRLLHGERKRAITTQSIE